MRTLINPAGWRVLFQTANRPVERVDPMIHALGWLTRLPRRGQRLIEILEQQLA